MAKEVQSRKWLITINNPEAHGLDLDTILSILKELKIKYWCLSEEIGEKGTRHIHIFILGVSPIRFHTLKKKFEAANLQKAYGSVQANRDYVAKSGKWADTEKAETSIPGTFIEFGELPTEENAEKAPSKLEMVYEDIKEGYSAKEIIDRHPTMLFKVKDLEIAIELYRLEKYKEQNRDVHVEYWHGPTGSGKTRGIYERHGARNIYRITHYPKNGIRFDGYHGEDVLVFEEFHSQIPIGEMLNFLDIYPLSLPARYSDKTACFTTVYITSNLSIEEQYTDLQIYSPETWKAFLRRIHSVKCIEKKEEVIQEELSYEE